jgi:pimeloyl-ACP methyl ester carboxylesterase
MQHFVRLFLSATATAVLLAGCQDSTAPAADLEPALSAGPIGGALRDAGIDPGDTHFGARLVTRTSFDAPGSGSGESAMLQVSSTSEVYERYDERYLEGGYGSQGEVRFGVYWDDAAASPEVASIRTVGDQVSSYNRSGGIIGSAFFDAFMAENGLPGGSLLDAFFNMDGGGCQVNCTPDLPTSIPDGGMVTQQETGDWREVRTVTSPATREAGATKAPAARTETVRRYRRMPAATGPATGRPSWRLEEIRHLVTASTPAGERTTRSETRLEYLRWHRNTGKDAARERAVARRPAPETPPKAPASAPASAWIAAGEPAASIGAASIDICGRRSSRVNQTVVSGGTSVIWQHGICSEAKTWDGMRPIISLSLQVGRERAFSLTSRDRLDIQTTELEQEVMATGGGSSIVIGHSQGGLIARRLGHRRGDLVHGVITMGSPHRGALIADLGPEVVSDYVTDAMGRFCYGSSMCRLLTEIGTRQTAGEITYGLAGTLVPVIHDVRTNSDFTTQLNSGYEPFLRAGIEVDAGNRWALMRLVGDWSSEDGRLANGARPRGEEWVHVTESIYRAGVFLQDLASFLSWRAYPYGGGVGCGYSGYQTHWPPCYDSWYGGYWYSWSYWAQLADILYSIGNYVTSRLDYLDTKWDYITTRNSDRTDGFIQFLSQRYPSSPGRYTPLRYIIRPPEADSHAGETASPGAFVRIKGALEAMGVPRQ